jgi:hypothetical protein
MTFLDFSNYVEILLILNFVGFWVIQEYNEGTRWLKLLVEHIYYK